MLKALNRRRRGRQLLFKSFPDFELDSIKWHEKKTNSNEELLQKPEIVEENPKMKNRRKKYERSQPNIYTETELTRREKDRCQKERDVVG